MHTLMHTPTPTQPTTHPPSHTHKHTIDGCNLTPHVQGPYFPAFYSAPLTRVSMLLVEIRGCFGSNNRSLSATASEVGLEVGQVLAHSALSCGVGRKGWGGRGGEERGGE